MSEALRQLDEFLRVYQTGFVAVWPLLGLASTEAWGITAVVALVAVSVCFNTFGGVLNDICDLPTDRQAQDRADRWLVTGRIPSNVAWLLVWAQLPAMLAIHYMAGFRWAAAAWMASALGGQAWYDLRGKKSRVPPLAESGEALAAASLVMYGATCLSDGVTVSTVLTAAAGAAFIFLVNAFHGGLRDIGDDVRAGVLTTPVWLGCAPATSGVTISRRMSVYGAAFLVIVLLSAWAVSRQVAAPAVPWLVLLFSALNVALFGGLHVFDGNAWDVALRLNVLSLMVPVMLAFVPVLGSGGSFVLFSVYLVPLAPLALRSLLRQRPD